MPFSLCLPLHFHLVFVWFSLPFLSLTFELKLYGTFRPYSQMGQSNNFEHRNNEWHGSCGAGLATWKPWFGSSSIQHKTLYFILLQSLYHPFLGLFWVHTSSFHHAGPSNNKLCNGFKFLQTSSPSATGVPHFVYSLVEQLMPQKCISTVFWDIPIIQFSMHQTSTHMYSTVSVAPSSIGSLTEISPALSPPL